MNAVRSIVRALRINTRAIELKMGISLAQLFVLQQLAERAADSLNDLAERTATHQSSVSVVVRRLVERGYVTRTSSSADKRRIEIGLTLGQARRPRDAGSGMAGRLKHRGDRVGVQSTGRLRLFAFSKHRWSGEVDLGGRQPPLEKVGERRLIVAAHLAQRSDELCLNGARRVLEKLSSFRREADLDAALVR